MKRLTIRSTASRTMIVLPLRKVIKVSGTLSTERMNSAFNRMEVPLSLVTLIMWDEARVRGGEITAPNCHFLSFLELVMVLSLEVDHFLEHLIRGGDDSRVRLECSLCDDHTGEFLGDVDVTHFQGSGDDDATLGSRRLADDSGP